MLETHERLKTDNTRYGKTKLEKSIYLYWDNKRKKVNSRNSEWLDTKSNYINFLYDPHKGKGAILEA